MREILNKVYSRSSQSYHDLLSEKHISNIKTVIVTANPEIIIESEKDDVLRNNLLNDMTLITADGIGVVKACKILLQSNVERLAGVESVSFLLSELSKSKGRLLVYGSMEEVLIKFKTVLETDYKGITSVLLNGYDNDYTTFETSTLNFRPDLVLVCMGVPRQEKYIFRLIDKVDKGIFIGCGGSIDVLSGSKKRAPLWIQKLNMEWLYRILKEPRRLNRFFRNQYIFAIKVLKERAKGGY